MKILRSIMGGLLLLVLSAGIVSGCEEECTPGDTQSCTCEDGRSGVHVCRPDGDGWTSCNCLGQ